MRAQRGQVSVEIVIIAGVMLTVLFTIFYVNQHLEASWSSQKERLEAGAAADQVALAINRAAAGGNTTRILFRNSVGQDEIVMANPSISRWLPLVAPPLAL